MSEAGACFLPREERRRPRLMMAGSLIAVEDGEIHRRPMERMRRPKSIQHFRSGLAGVLQGGLEQRPHRTGSRCLLVDDLPCLFDDRWRVPPALKASLGLGYHTVTGCSSDGKYDVDASGQAIAASESPRCNRSGGGAGLRT